MPTHLCSRVTSASTNRRGIPFSTFLTIAFRDHAPESAEHSQDYATSDQLIVTYAFRLVGIRIGKGAQKTVPYGPEETMAVSYIPGKESKDGRLMPLMRRTEARSIKRKIALSELRAMTSERRPERVLVINTNSAMESFLGQRFFTIKAGECAEESGMKLDTAWKFGRF